jgi:hypothetical protein
MARRPPDFLATVAFVPYEQGGRRTQPVQGYRADIRYDDDPPGQAWMVWPRFVSADGTELPSGTAVPPTCEANFFIVSDELRREVHVGRLRPGLHFTMVEGQRVVASCVVKRVLSLQSNAA